MVMLNLARKLRQHMPFRLFLIATLISSQLSLSFHLIPLAHASSSGLPRAVEHGIKDPTMPEVLTTVETDGSEHREVRTAFLVNMMEADQFSKELTRHILEMQTRGLGGDRVVLDVHHFGPRGSIPNELKWIISHAAALKERGVPIALNIVYVDREGVEASTRLLNDFARHETEISRLSSQAGAQVEDLMTTLDSLYELVERLGASSEAMESNLDLTPLERWALTLKSTLLPSIQKHVSQIKLQISTPSVRPEAFSERHKWYESMGEGLRDLLVAYEELTVHEVKSGLESEHKPAIEKTRTLISSVIELLDSVSHRYEKLAGFYTVHYERMAESADSGRDVDDREIRGLMRRVGRHAGLAVRRFFDLPQGMTFFMYRHIFRRSTHESAIQEALRMTRQLRASTGISTVKALRQAYPNMSSDTRKILELYGMAAFRALVGLGISIGAMSYSAASHPDIVTHPYIGGVVAASWMLFTGVIGVANIDFFNQAKRYDAYRGYVTNKLFFYASSLVHSFLIAVNVQQVYYANLGLNAGIYQHTLNNSILSTFAKLAPTLFIAKNRDNGTGNVEVGSRKHTVHRTIFFTFAFDFIYQVIKSLNLFDQKNKPVEMILNVMAVVGGVVLIRDYWKTRQEIRELKSQEVPMGRSEQRTVIRLLRTTHLCSSLF
jgi:hypothetical protein